MSAEEARKEPANAGGRDGLSHRVVFGVLAISLAMAFALALHVYQRYVRYERHVAQHMPADYAVALHLSVEQAVVYDPFRQHLLALLEANRASIPEGGRKSVPRLDILRDETSIELGVDLRELGIVVDPAGSWLLLLGGHFRADGVASGVRRMLQQEGVRTEVRAGSERLVHESGITLAAAPDGVLAIGQTESIVLGALSSRADHPAFASGAAFSLRLGPGGAGPLEGAVLTVLPGQTFEADFVLPHAPAELEDARLSELLSGNTGDFKLLAATKDWRFERAPGGGRHAHGVLSRAEFDRLVQELAAGLAHLMGLERPEPAQAPGAHR